MDIRCPCVTSKLDLFKGVGGGVVIGSEGRGGGGGRRERKGGEERGQSQQVDRGM